jgi:hypothetical protein
MNLDIQPDRELTEEERLFGEHKLPLKDALLGELRSWLEYAEQGRRFSQQCDMLMHKVMRLVERVSQR